MFERYDEDARRLAADRETSREIVNTLQEKFALISRRLTPEVEPAQVYSLQPPGCGTQSAE